MCYGDNSSYISMAALVRTKGKRYVSVDLQTQGAKRFSFKEINKHGSLNGYITGIVDTVYAVFQHPYYGKLRKIVLKENRYDDDDDDDDDDIDQCPKLSFFARGKVAEKCAEIRKRETVLLENPYVEFTNVQDPVYHLAGDKNLSDISVWAINKNSTLLVGKDEENGEEQCQNGEHSQDNAQVNVVDTQTDSSTEDEEPSPSLLHSPRKLRNSLQNKGHQTKGTDVNEKEVHNSVQVTRSRPLHKSNATKHSPRINGSTVPEVQKSIASPVTKNSVSKEDKPKETSRVNTRKSAKETKDISSRKDKPKQTSGVNTRKNTKETKDDEINKEVEKENSSTLRVTRSEASRVEAPNNTKSPMLLRNRKKHKTDNKECLPSRTKSPKLSPKPSRKENAPLKRKTRSSSSQEEISENQSSQPESDNASPVLKRKRRPLFGPKGISSSPADQPVISNVVVVLSSMNKQLTKEDTNHNQKSSNKTSDTSHSKTNNPRRLRSHASNAASADIEMSQESNEDQIIDSQTISQPSTPSGIFKSTRNKLNKNNKDGASTPGTPGKTAALKATKATTPSGTITIHVPGTPGDTNLAQGGSSNAQASSTDDNATNKKQATDNARQSPRVTSAVDNQPVASTSTRVVADVPNTPTRIQQSSIRDSYHLPSNYTKISDVQINTIVNLYGVVKYFKPPWKSRGTDMCSIVVLADPSTDEPLECVMFKDAVYLPQVRRVGDIVRLHRMNIKKYKDKFQALSTRGFSAIVFDRNVSIPVSQEAARFGTGSFSFESTDKDIVKTLKEWQISQADLFEPAKFLTVSEVEPELYFDIVCQVKGVLKQTNLDCVCLKVTDGTNPKHEIKSCVEDGSYEEVLNFDPSQCRFKAFDVFLYGDHALLLMNLKVSIGTILLLHNVHSVMVEGGPGASLLDVVEPTLELCLHRGSEYGRGLVVLNKESTDVQGLLGRLK